MSVNGFDISESTFASCAISGLHKRNNMSRIFFIANFLLSYALRVELFATGSKECTRLAKVMRIAAIC
jgi:hypothetical protein